MYTNNIQTYIQRITWIQLVILSLRVNNNQYCGVTRHVNVTWSSARGAPLIQGLYIVIWP